MWLVGERVEAGSRFSQRRKSVQPQLLRLHIPILRLICLLKTRTRHRLTILLRSRILFHHRMLCLAWYDQECRLVWDLHQVPWCLDIGCLRLYVATSFQLKSIIQSDFCKCFACIYSLVTFQYFLNDLIFLSEPWPSLMSGSCAYFLPLFLVKFGFASAEESDKWWNVSI